MYNFYSRCCYNNATTVEIMHAFTYLLF